MRTIQSLKIEIESIVSKLKAEEKTEKADLKLELLKNIQDILNTSKAQSVVNALNCLEDGNDLPYAVLKGLLRLSTRACCGHFCVLAALNFSKVKIDFYLFIDLLIKGRIVEKTNLLSSKYRDFTTWLPCFYQEPNVDFKDIIINRELFIKEMIKQPDGLYLFKGIDAIDDEGHLFMLIKHNTNFYYADNNAEGSYKDTSKKFSTMFPDLSRYTLVKGHYISSLNRDMLIRLKRRIDLLLPPKTLLNNLYQSSKPEEVKPATTLPSKKSALSCTII